MRQIIHWGPDSCSVDFSSWGLGRAVSVIYLQLCVRKTIGQLSLAVSKCGIQSGVVSLCGINGKVIGRSLELHSLRPEIQSCL